ncbi:type II CRISPR RNA-guided endonuclease Cas9 [Geobacillus stearothermophilus]|uniref:type II CRISPR RNA-guided endonuclease Cas9 n=1 Tax=Geobacillus stearothermophilus TaxID=1422 RepID=UPI002E221A90|nr:type II CRISPR RNA-guided endonuclease Cas9 [Geobacillus stearothermophilus]MED3730472.1 type II CRISPR RNA-guided endonuclease Cas9 [Geobacillus stearothermophilus]
MRYKIGLDIGITSVGWAVINLDIPRIEDLGVRIFDRAENPQTGESLALPRRLARSARRRLRRRKHRLERIRRLVIREGILTKEELDKLFEEKHEIDVWQLRVEALDRKLNNDELARVLLHLAKRRGFKSNRKSERSNKENSTMLKHIEENRAILSSYRTVGEMIVKDPKFALHKRNKGENYTNTIARDDLEREIRLIFSKQREFGNMSCTEEFENEYIAIWASQRPVASKDDIEKKVGFCTFEPKEKRAPKATYTFQSFIAWEHINKLRLISPSGARGLTDEERRLLYEQAFQKNKITYHDIRTLLHLPDDTYFKGIVYDRGESRKQNENIRFLELDAYHQIRKAVDKVYGKGKSSSFLPIDFDTFGYALTLFKDDADIHSYLRNEYEQNGKRMPNLANKVYDNELIEELLNLSFTKFGHLSLKALRNILPYMEQGEVYSSACERAGYTFTGPKKKQKTMLLPNIPPIANPVVMRALTQAWKVVNAIIKKYGSPVSIHIELARDLSQTFDERRKTKKEQDENRKKNETAIRQLMEYGLTLNPTGHDIVKFKLWSEQNGRCAYSLQPIEIERLLEPGYVEVDHVIPYSRSLDDSYTNKVLVLTRENREKGNRIPAEYLGVGTERWQQFETFVLTNKQFSKKKRDRLLRLHYDENEETEFKNRNLNDTRYISRFFANFIREHLKFAESDDKQKVYTVNGRVTAHLRSRWEFNKNREESDLHHAVDAVIVACTTPSDIAKVTAFYQRREQNKELAKKTEPHFPQPWPHFADELRARLSKHPKESIKALNLGNYDDQKLESLQPVFVSRMPKRSVTGAAHQETLRRYVGIDERSGKIQTVVKTKLSEIKLDASGHFPMYGKESDPRTYEAIRQRLLEHNNDPKKAFQEPLYKPKKNGEPGPVIRTVKIIDTKNQVIPLNDGKTVAYNSNIVRVDVFEKDGKYYCVPVYTMDIMKGILPNKAIEPNKPYSEWKEMTEDYTFRFSLYPNDLIRIELPREKTVKTAAGEEINVKDVFVYYKTIDSANGGLELISHDHRFSLRGVGSRTLKRFEKYQVDVLGNIYKVRGEKRVGLASSAHSKPGKTIRPLQSTRD